MCILYASNCCPLVSTSIEMICRPGIMTSPSIRSSPPSSVYSEHIPNITLASTSVHKNTPINILPSVITTRKYVCKRFRGAFLE
uniref:Uncharacterized protein n=1 Tax=Lutzomyia longipalpis TaxID=7200 RepID=A0A1B0CKP3_LUTLO